MISFEPDIVSVPRSDRAWTRQPPENAIEFGIPQKSHNGRSRLSLLRVLVASPTELSYLVMDEDEEDPELATDLARAPLGLENESHAPAPKTLLPFLWLASRTSPRARLSSISLSRKG